jgi:hypothetical protein
MEVGGLLQWDSRYLLLGDLPLEDNRLVVSLLA